MQTIGLANHSLRIPEMLARRHFREGGGGICFEAQVFSGVGGCKLWPSMCPQAQDQYMQEHFLGELPFARKHAGLVSALARIQDLF